MCFPQVCACYKRHSQCAENKLNQKGKQLRSVWKYQNRNTRAAGGNEGTAKALPDLKAMSGTYLCSQGEFISK